MYSDSVKGVASFHFMFTNNVINVLNIPSKNVITTERTKEIEISLKQERSPSGRQFNCLQTVFPLYLSFNSQEYLYPK